MDKTLESILGPNIAPIVQSGFESMSVEVLAVVMLTAIVLFASFGTNYIFPRRW